MAKSRAKRSQKKIFDNFRNALFWILCCGRLTVREDAEITECKTEKVAEPECVIGEITCKREITPDVPASPEGPAPAPISSASGGETIKQDQSDAIEKKIAELELNIGKIPTSQQHSSANKASAESSKATSDVYPEHLNPFADDQDGGNGDDDCGTSESGNKEKGENPIEEYPEYLNPFSEEEDGQKETEEHEYQWLCHTTYAGITLYTF